MSDQDNKQEQIIQVALKRFSHFGITKTTMNEIAEDLGISKALLYYYFPDKVSLVIEVLKLIFSEFIEENFKSLTEASNVKEGLNSIIDVRTQLGKKYFMLHMNDGHSDINLTDKRFKSVLMPLKEKEHKMISDFLKAAVEKKELKDIDCENVAHLLIDVLTGIWIFELHVKCKVLIPSQEQFDSINNKNKQLIEIFYDGIKNNSNN